MNLRIKPIKEKDYTKVYKFQCEYLDKESYDNFLKRVKLNPDLYLVAFDGDELIGICYGHPSKSFINLQGIAVNLDKKKDYARKGIGSKLIREFEKAVKKKGYNKISLGASDDLKVEHFYLKNNFKPYELVAKSSKGKEYDRVKVKDYEIGKIKQKGLRKKYRPKEVIFIFNKIV